MKKNPFAKYIKGETAIHIEVAKYLQWQYPDVMFHHSPNEGKRTSFERYLISQMGVSAGFPDFVIYRNNIQYALELKYKDNLPTEQQLKWLKYFSKMKHSLSFVCWSFESAKKIIDVMMLDNYTVLSDYNIKLDIVDNNYHVDTQDILPVKIKELIEQ